MSKHKKLINEQLTSSQLLSNQKNINHHNKPKNAFNLQYLNNKILKEITLGINNNNNLDHKAFRINLENLKYTFSIFYFELLNNSGIINNNEINILNQTNIENNKGRIYFKHNNVNTYLKIGNLVDEISLINDEIQATIFELELSKDSKGSYIKLFNRNQDFNYLILGKDGKISFLNRDTLYFGYIFRDKREIHQFIIS